MNIIGYTALVSLIGLMMSFGLGGWTVKDHRGMAVALARSSRGFTLIELLVVITIVGILAAIAIPQLQLHRERVLKEAMRQAVRDAAVAEEVYYVRSERYTGDCGALNYDPPANVAIECYLHKGGDAFSVIARHPRLDWACAYDSDMPTEMGSSVECGEHVGHSLPMGDPLAQGTEG